MAHPLDGTLQSFLDGELTPGECGETARHLAECGACAIRLEELRVAAGVFSGASARLEEPARLELAQERLQWVARRRRATAARRVLARAAMVTLTVGAAAAAALPGSPLRAWVTGAWETLATYVSPAPPAPVATVPGAEDPAQPLPARVGGISILPAEGRIRVALENPSPEAEIRVLLVEGERAAVRTEGEAAHARFRSAPGQIEIVGAGAGRILIELPLRLHVGVVEVNGRPYVVKEGATLRFVGPALDTIGGEVQFRVPSR
jgi:hypothetical protein